MKEEIEIKKNNRCKCTLEYLKSNRVLIEEMKELKQEKKTFTDIITNLCKELLNMTISEKWKKL